MNEKRDPRPVRLRAALALLLGCVLAGSPAHTQVPAASTLPWAQLPPLPDPVGFAGPFVPVKPGPSLANQPREAVMPPVTTVTTTWNGAVLIPSGEIRPGTRTARVLRMESPPR